MSIDETINTPKKILITKYHLAGIVPVSATMKAEFGMMWPDALMPLAPNYTIIENAILTAAYAGCETIWVVMDTKTILPFKQVLGDWVRDPIKHYDGMPRKIFAQEDKRIPIIYVPVKPYDFKRRESIPWSIIIGVRAAYATTYKLTRWLTPDAYFVSFPYGIVDHKMIQKSRDYISSRERFYCSYEGKTVRDGCYLPFTFFLPDHIKYKARWKEKATGKYDRSFANPREEKEKLPIEERYSGRYLDVKDVYDVAEISEKDHVVEMPWFYDVSSWEGYRGFLGNDKTKDIKRPSQKVFPIVRFRKWLPMGEDEILEEEKEEENE